MKKRVLAILMAAVISMSLIACGGKDDASTSGNDAAVEKDVNANEESDAADSVTGEFSEEQAALAQEYLELCEAFDAAADLVNNTPAILEQEEVVNTMNEVADALISLDECFGDPELLTEEVMVQVEDAIEKGYAFIDEVNLYVEAESGAASTETAEWTVEEMASVLTIAWAGADEEENTYYFVCDEEVTFGMLVVLTADMTQNVNCVGEITENKDGSITINDETGYTSKIATTQVDGGLIATINDELEVAMVSYDAAEILELIFEIDTQTENINE